MKTAIQLIALLVCASHVAWAAEESRFVTIETLEGQRVQVLNDNLFVRSSFTQRRDPNAKPFTVTAHVFEMCETDKGTQLIVRTAPSAPRGFKATSALEGCYLTADFSTDKPVVAFAKEARNDSYWEVDKRGVQQVEFERFEGKRIRLPPSQSTRTKNEKGEWMYLSIDKSAQLFVDHTVVGTLTCYPFTLTREPTTKFRFEMIFRLRDGL